MTSKDPEVDHFWEFARGFILKYSTILVINSIVGLFIGGLYKLAVGEYPSVSTDIIRYPELVILFHTIYYQFVKKT